MAFKSLGHKFRIFSFSVKMALRSMRYRSFRTLLTVLGISIGITTFVALMSVGIGMEMQVASLINTFMGAGMMVSSDTSSNRPAVPQEVADRLLEIEGVNETICVIEDFVQIRGELLNLVGVEADKLLTAMGITIEEGVDLITAINNGTSNPVLIDKSASNILGYTIGDNIILASMFGGGFFEFEIVGITSAFQIDISFIMAGFAYTALEIMQDILATDMVQYIRVTIDDGYDPNDIANVIRATYPDAEVTTSEEMLAMSEQIMNMLFAVLMAIGSISLMVGALMITNTTMMSVLERTREIGIVKSIGGKRSHVLIIFMTESVLIALIGGILGCIFSVIAVMGLTGIVYSMYGFPLAYNLQPWIFMVGLGMASGIGAIAGAIPSFRAASVKPVEALRYQ
ncbi:MAG: ABC transporter permease [Candidatus Helarchaeota archaeon]|nr:ABC transporter permease [Candidatus Helarchaeota archaeon]